ncbi:hypothetical protein Poli38472_000892 [Pythium oligandrum]|uniref:Alkaline phosphatase n=1 Tax=Pythium oligandrum TaxID=41045 RepID=A0A8K1CCY5_PYTOL|nr:hypothetical protein Poli38472_000892 [Pythium oligandrum]|eukprot:TMW60850.1 hypothetical protein Poli38472_000892 [Pythium oligandrum]
MKSKLQVVLDGRCGSNELSKTKLLAMSQQLIQTNSNVTTLSDTDLAGLKREITKVVDITRSLSDVTVEMARIISWTTIGHVGTDVDLHCMGPTVLERMCKGLHENTYLDKIMANYLNLEHQQSIETLRLRNFTTLEYASL